MRGLSVTCLDIVKQRELMEIDLKIVFLTCWKRTNSWKKIICLYLHSSLSLAVTVKTVC